MKTNTFKGAPNVPYIKKGGNSSGTYKAVLHVPGKKIIAYRTLGELKRNHPEFKHLTRAYVEIKDYKVEIWVAK